MASVVLATGTGLPGTAALGAEAAQPEGTVLTLRLTFGAVTIPRVRLPFGFPVGGTLVPGTALAQVVAAVCNSGQGAAQALAAVALPPGRAQLATVEGDTVVLQWVKAAPALPLILGALTAAGSLALSLWQAGGLAALDLPAALAAAAVAGLIAVGIGLLIVHWQLVAQLVQRAIQAATGLVGLVARAPLLVALAVGLAAAWWVRREG